MKRKHIIQLLFVILMLPMVTSAQEIIFKAMARGEIRVGETVQVVFELNAEGENFRGPDFAGWRILNGPMSSTNSSIQVINGKMSQSYTQSFTYIVSASKEGTLTVGSASVMVNGKKYSSEPLSIKVLPANAQANSSGRQDSGQQGVSDKDVFLKAIANKTKAVVGEQVIVTYRIYTRVPISSVNVSKLSSFGGFWMKNLLDDNDALQQSTTTIDGEEYVIADVRKVALFPQKTGKLKIDPMELECVAQIRTQPDRRRSRDPFESFFNDPFFNRGISNVQKTLESEALEITVQPLPTEGKPNNFTGAVGQFGLESAIDRTNLKTNEAVNLSLTVTGSGNLELIDLPRPVFPPDFEVYDPKSSTNLKTGPNGVSGSKKTEFLFIPRVPGDFTIDPVTFTYFDPVKKAYQTLQSKAFTIHVEKGENMGQEGVVYASPQEGVKYLGTDIRHIKTNHFKLTKANSFFFGSVLYYSLIALLVVAFFLGLFLVRKQTKLRQNQSLVRNKKATKIARKRLKEAHTFFKNKQQNEFYNEMSQALWGYIADKFYIQQSQLSIDSVTEALVAKNTPQELIDLFVQTLQNCEYARFAPGEAGKKMEDLYQQGIEAITKAEKMIK